MSKTRMFGKHRYTHWAGALTLREAHAHKVAAKEDYQHVRMVKGAGIKHSSYEYHIWVHGRKK